tara:strand:+ start:167 stop:595 length:429 start_codon:yes stop_codon:yes gene_type:complete
MRILCILLATSTCAFARLNEDIIALESRYGAPTFVWSSLGSAETFAAFDFQGRVIWAVLSEGECVAESINFGPTKVYSSEQASKLGADTAKFILGLLNSAYNWPEKEAASVCEKIDTPITYGEMIAKYTFDVNALEFENTYK